MKFKRLRRIYESVKNLVRGWSWKITSEKYNDDLKTGWTKIASCTTPIKDRSDDETTNRKRMQNIRLGASLVDRTLLRSGEIFSMMESVGEATLERGFQAGPIFIQGDLEYTVGGGLCQISSTLFNAALSANMNILERKNHSLDLWGEERFIDLGRDATYVYCLIDLKFQNTLDFPVIVRCQADAYNKTLTCEFLGERPLECEVTIHSEILEELDPSPDTAGGKQVQGWVVRTTRRIEKDGTRSINYDTISRYEPAVLPE